MIQPHLIYVSTNTTVNVSSRKRREGDSQGNALVNENLPRKAFALQILHSWLCLWEYLGYLWGPNNSRGSCQECQPFPLRLETEGSYRKRIGVTPFASFLLMTKGIEHSWPGEHVLSEVLEESRQRTHLGPRTHHLDCFSNHLVLRKRSCSRFNLHKRIKRSHGRGSCIDSSFQEEQKFKKKIVRSSLTVGIREYFFWCPTIHLTQLTILSLCIAWFKFSREGMWVPTGKPQIDRSRNSVRACLFTLGKAA